MHHLSRGGSGLSTSQVWNLSGPIGVQRAQVDRPNMQSGRPDERQRSVSNLAKPTFEEFVEQATPQLLRRAHAITGQPHDALDLLQDALIKVGARWRSIDDPIAYTNRAMTHLHVSRWRKLRREHLTPTIDRDSVVVYDPIGKVDQRDAIVSALSELNERQRTVIVLHYIYDVSVIEISAQTGMKESTVLSHLHRGREALRAQLQSRLETSLAAEVATASPRRQP